MTSTTTIKVSTDTRDRLRAQAAVAGVSLGEHLKRLADLADRASRFAAMKAAMDATSVADMGTYRAETTEWADAELTAAE